MQQNQSGSPPFARKQIGVLNSGMAATQFLLYHEGKGHSRHKHQSDQKKEKKNVDTLGILSNYNS